MTNNNYDELITDGKFVIDGELLEAVKTVVKGMSGHLELLQRLNDVDDIKLIICDGKLGKYDIVRVSTVPYY